MATYWFKPKRYGYGATPVTWQGWAVTLGSVVAIVVAALLLLHNGDKGPGAWMAFFAIEAVVIAILWIISRRKTDGEWRWRWGDGR
ncbi:MAG TPA: hypothetical protein VK430_06190 [Xanthobacteraceae bacterium]|nr:hypothetical protein [Xanthobacteraceae bacterium]HXX03918.1 hypothetical protein [Xanthobacteraceae bacterium]